MLNLVQIQRLMRLRQHRQLIERILPAGRCRSRQAAEHLAGREGAEPAALGLALVRCCQLTYAPTPLAKGLAARLTELRRGDGLFGEGSEPVVGASAAALCGLIEWREQCEAVGQGSADLNKVIDRSIHALASRQDANGLLRGDAVGSAIAMSLLGDRAEFRAAVDLDLLKSAVESCGGVAVDLSRYAQAMAA